MAYFLQGPDGLIPEPHTPSCPVPQYDFRDFLKDVSLVLGIALTVIQIKKLDRR